MKTEQLFIFSDFTELKTYMSFVFEFHFTPLKCYASVPYLSGLNPSSSSRKTLLLVTVLSGFGMMRNLRMVPLLDPRNSTVLFL